MIDEAKIGILLFDLVFDPENSLIKFTSLNNEEKNLLYLLATRNSLAINLEKFLTLHHLIVPRDILIKAQQENHRSINRYNQTLKLLHEFNHEGINLIVLKGTAIGLALVNNPHYKRMNDFDFLVQESQVDNTIKLLKKLGYWDTFKLFDKNLELKKDYHAPPYFYPDGSIVLGLHWGLVSPKKSFNFNYHDLWARSVVIDSMSQARRLSWEDHLLHIAVHQNYLKLGIRELFDVALILEKTNINLNVLNELAIQAKCQSELEKILAAISPFLPNHTFKSDHYHFDTSLPFYRTLLVSSVEKAFAISRLSKNVHTKFTHWLKMWKLCWFANDFDLRALYHLPQNQKATRCERLKAPFICLKIIAKDHDPALILIITFIHALQAMFWGLLLIVKIPFQNKDLESETFIPLINDLE